PSASLAASTGPFRRTTMMKIPICAASQQIGRTPGGAKAVDGNVQQPGNDKQPSLDCRQRAFGTSCMHQKQGEGLRKYLKQVTVRPNEAPADARNLAVHHETLGPKCRLANGVSARSIG